MKQVVIVDYGMGNIRSVVNAFEYVGAKVKLTKKLPDIKDAAAIVVPGQGAFRDCIANLRKNNLTETLTDEVVKKGKPFLGICMGLEILADKGFEGGEFDGLGWISGTTKRFKLSSQYKIPHLGWNEIKIKKPTWLFKGLSPNPSFYFAHSYYLQPKDPSWIVASCHYGIKFAAALQKENIVAVQFHPEKSQHDGLQLIKNFVNSV